MNEIEVTVRIPLSSIDHIVKPQLVATGNGNQDQIDSYDVEATAIWAEAYDVNGNKVKVNILDLFDKSAIEEAVFNALNL